MLELGSRERLLLSRIVAAGPLRLTGADRCAAQTLVQRGLVRAVISHRLGGRPYYVSSGAGYAAIEASGSPATQDAVSEAA